MVTQVIANDVDMSSVITYSFSDNSSTNFPFAIDRYTGVVTLTRALDYEEQAEYTLAVSASDSLHQTSGEVKVQVLDVNDNAPVFTKVSYQVRITCLLGRRAICQQVEVSEPLIKHYTCVVFTVLQRGKPFLSLNCRSLNNYMV